MQECGDDLCLHSVLTLQLSAESSWCHQTTRDRDSDKPGRFLLPVKRTSAGGSGRAARGDKAFGQEAWS